MKFEIQKLDAKLLELSSENQNKKREMIAWIKK